MIFTAALVENTIFCMHGGLSPDLYDPRELNKIERPLDIPNKGVLCDLLWSDPDPVSLYVFQLYKILRFSVFRI